MSYGAKYELYVNSVNNRQYRLIIYEDGYSGSVQGLNGAQQPLVHAYNTEDDDPFQPIVTSTLTVNVDITDVNFAGGETIPDLTNQNDFKYYCILLSGSSIFFRGYLLSDQTTLPFNSGRKILSMKFIDGLTMLKNIPLPFTSTHPNVYEDLRTTLIKCLEPIEYPSVLRYTRASLKIICNIFGDGMATKATSANNEPLSQSFVANRTWMNNDVTYQNCWDVLEAICKSFGAQLCQAEGDWWFCNVVERARTSADVVTVSLTSGAVTSSGTKNMGFNLKPYTPATEDLYFVNGSQNKRIKKGFANINVKHTFKTHNLVPNAQFEEVTAGQPDFWSVTSSGTGSVTASMDTIKDYDAYKIAGTGSITRAYVAVDMQSLTDTIAEMGSNVRFKLSFNYQSTLTGGAPTKPLGAIMLFVNRQVGASNVESYHLKFNNDQLQWSKAAVASIPWSYGNIPFADCPQVELTNLQQQTYSIETPYLPDFASGTADYDTGIVYLAIGFDSTTYDMDWKIANFTLEAITTEESLNINYSATDGKYSDDIELSIGAENNSPYDDNVSFNGAIFSNSGSNARKIFPLWTYYYTITGSSQFISLLHWSGECRANTVTPTNIVLEGDIQGAYAKRIGDSSVSPFSYICNIVAQDDSAAPYSVNGQKYAPTRLNIDYKADILNITLAPIYEFTARTPLTQSTTYKLRQEA